jgi:hypothetical protein
MNKKILNILQYNILNYQNSKFYQYQSLNLYFKYDKIKLVFNKTEKKMLR